LDIVDGLGLTVPAAIWMRGHLFFSDDGVNPESLRRAGGHWFYQDHWSNGYREVYVEYSLRCIFTCCEGDLDVTVDDSAESFEARIRSAEEFYQGGASPVEWTSNLEALNGR
jgi:hypothetical protein